MQTHAQSRCRSYEACWSFAYSYYSISKSHQSMMGAQRISKAGSCAVHTTLKELHEKSVVQVSNDEWMSHLTLGGEEGAYDRFKALLEEVARMVAE